MIKPLNENVLVKVLENENEGEGVLLPDSHRKEKFGMGKVVRAEDDSLLEAGDIVIFDTILLTNVKVEGEELSFIKFSDILAYERGTETDNS